MPMTRYIIDRFEDGDWAVLEADAQRRVTVLRSWLPASAREGDVLTLSEQDEHAGAKILRFEVDMAARVVRLEEARQLRQRLPEGPKDDISL
jgi:hypothetical protein